MRTALVAVAAAVAAVAAGCSDAAPAVPARVAATSTASASSAPPSVVYDWVSRRAVQAGDGWTVGACEGDAPLVCVRRGDVVVTAEISRIPLDSVPSLQRLVASGAATDAVLRAHGDEYVEIFRDDRTEGCGASFAFTPEPVVVEAGVVRTGFRGRAASGSEERALRWAAVRGQELVALTASAQDPDGCLGTEGQATTAAFDAARPVLEAVVRGSSLPR